MRHQIPFPRHAFSTATSFPTSSSSSSDLYFDASFFAASSITTTSASSSPASSLTPNDSPASSSSPSSSVFSSSFPESSLPPSVRLLRESILLDRPDDITAHSRHSYGNDAEEARKTAPIVDLHLPLGQAVVAGEPDDSRLDGDGEAQAGEDAEDERLSDVVAGRLVT